MPFPVGRIWMLLEPVSHKSIDKTDLDQTIPMLNKYNYLRFIVLAFAFFAAGASVGAQTEDEIVKATARALVLFEQQQYAEAVPHFEIVVKGMPNEPKLRFLYGFCLVAKSKQISDTAEAQQLSAKALEQFREAKKLGLKDSTNDALIAMLSGQPSQAAIGGESVYSSNAQAEKLMNDAENLFAQSKYDEAIKLFEKALALDPKIYQAGTSGGDSYVAKGDWENAEKWYQKAIAIDPNRETAYRYSATPLIKQKKYDQARDRYIEAYIVEPYNQMSLRGINQWAEITGKSLGHPVVEVPEFTFDSKGKALPKSPIAGGDQAMSPWLAYFTARESWKNEKFSKAFPKEPQYRHTLAEEAESLRAALKAAQEIKSSNKQFELLGRLDKDGLLEAFVLLGRPDQGIANDHEEYLKNNRPKLRLYVANYVIQK